MALAILIGGGSLLLFGVFLIIGPITIARLDASEYQVLLWDGLLSILFFIQHSGMIRASFHNRLAPIIPRHYHPSTYAIASGIALTALVLLWQPSQTVLYQAEGLRRRQAQGGVSGQGQVKKDGPNQNRLKVAGYPVIGFNLFERRNFNGANIFPETAAGMETASRRRLDGTGNIPFQDNPLSIKGGVGDWIGR